MILVDTHVHIYDCFDLEKFFDSAYANFKSAAQSFGGGDDFTGILFLTETSQENWFLRLVEYADGKDLTEGKDTGNWIFRRTNENISLRAETGDSKSLILIGGRQVVTREGLEVLACATIDNFGDDVPLENLIREIKKKDGLPIIPWGIGKWFGNRGKLIKEIIKKYDNEASIHLGDNGNRPVFWPQPKLLKQARQRGIQVLPGSDPLPFVSETDRAGSYGFLMPIEINLQKPANHLKQLLVAEKNYTPRVFGRLEQPHRFLLNQIRAQLKKRFN